MASNLETAAAQYAEHMQAKYIAKRGGSVPASAALDVYMWAFNRFMANPDR